MAGDHEKQIERECDLMALKALLLRKQLDDKK